MKRYYYVLVFTSKGPIFVTKDESKYAYWEKKDRPKLFTTREYAEDVANGLTLNMNYAVVVSSKYEIDNQPYAYSVGEFEWKYEKEDD